MNVVFSSDKKEYNTIKKVLKYCSLKRTVSTKT